MNQFLHKQRTLPVLSIFFLLYSQIRARSSIVVKVLGYKPEGHGFETQ
jgi:hypothetical protein